MIFTGFIANLFLEQPAEQQPRLNATPSERNPTNRVSKSIDIVIPAHAPVNENARSLLTWRAMICFPASGTPISFKGGFCF